MPPANQHNSNIKKKTILIFILITVLWTALILGLSYYSYTINYDNVFVLAKSSAVDSFRKDLVYRKWAAIHGGVYVPITDHTPPNPHLAHIPDRDVQTTDGKNMTLVNPAYMTRQVHELGSKEYGLIGHITSLDPIRPANAPDKWEERALRSFETGAKEYVSLDWMGDARYFRYMAPMLVEASCLKCHALQGYKVGQIRGGISVSVPWNDFETSIKNGTRDLLTMYGLIWACGMIGILTTQRVISSYIYRQEATLEALARSEGMLSAVLRNTPVGIGLVKDRFIHWTNDFLEEMTGYSKDELCGKSVRILYETEGEFRRVSERLYSEMSQKGKSGIETSFVRKNGSVANIMLNLAPIDETDLAAGAVFASVDITEAKKTAKMLQKNTLRLERAELAAKFGNWEFDYHTRTIKYSEGARRILDLQTELADVNDLRQMPMPEYKPLLEEALTGLIEQQKPYDLEFKALRQTDGQMIDIHTIAGFDKRFNVAWGVIQDVTRRKRAEEGLREMERRLFRAQKLESLGILSAGIAHDFNNLLAVIVGNLELAQNSKFSASQKDKFIERAMSASTKSANLIRQMLDYSGKGAFELDEINLSELVQENARTFEATAPENTHLEIKTPPGDILIKADPVQMKQVVMNLLTNASEALEGKEGTVELSAGVEFCDDAALAKSLLLKKPPAQNMAFLQVRDNGCGMDAETLNNIFDPFFSTKFTGRGLGMSVVQGIVMGHGGAIMIDSLPGRGTTVTVYIPIAQTHCSG